ncbi:MAG: hypothetical protein PHS44_03665 [Candidatus Dojkabacteria bacterium]|nr:hypothetical protein [Candidatus Dojkabacteria bacterium]
MEVFQDENSFTCLEGEIQRVTIRGTLFISCESVDVALRAYGLSSIGPESYSGNGFTAIRLDIFRDIHVAVEEAHILISQRMPVLCPLCVVIDRSCKYIVYGPPHLRVQEFLSSYIGPSDSISSMIVTFLIHLRRCNFEIAGEIYNLKSNLAIDISTSNPRLFLIQAAEFPTSHLVSNEEYIQELTAELQRIFDLHTLFPWSQLFVS